MKLISVTPLLLWSLLMMTATVAQADVVVDSTLAEGKQYGLYIGSADGTLLEYIGQNSTDAKGGALNSKYSWNLPETWSSSCDDLGEGLYLYLVAWDGLGKSGTLRGGPQNWFGELTVKLSDQSEVTLAANATDWLYCWGASETAGPGNGNAYGNRSLGLEELCSQIGRIYSGERGLQWHSGLFEKPEGDSSAGFQSYDKDTKFIGPVAPESATSKTDTNYVVFRSAKSVAPPADPPVVPEPVSIVIWTLLGAGWAGLAWRRRAGRKVPEWTEGVPTIHKGSRWSDENRQAILKMIERKKD